MAKNFNLAIFLDTVNRINAKLCTVIELIKLYLFIPLSKTLVACQGHSDIKELKVKVVIHDKLHAIRLKHGV